MRGVSFCGGMLQALRSGKAAWRACSGLWWSTAEGCRLAPWVPCGRRGARRVEDRRRSSGLMHDEDRQPLQSVEPAGRVGISLLGLARRERGWRHDGGGCAPRPGAPCGRGRQRGDGAPAIGRSRGGRTTQRPAGAAEAGRRGRPSSKPDARPPPASDRLASRGRHVSRACAAGSRLCEEAQPVPTNAPTHSSPPSSSPPHSSGGSIEAGPSSPESQVCGRSLVRRGDRSAGRRRGWRRRIWSTCRAWDCRCGFRCRPGGRLRVAGASGGRHVATACGSTRRTSARPG